MAADIASVEGGTTRYQSQYPTSCIRPAGGGGHADGDLREGKDALLRLAPVRYLLEIQLRIHLLQVPADAPVAIHGEGKDHAMAVGVDSSDENDL